VDHKLGRRHRPISLAKSVEKYDNIVKTRKRAQGHLLRSRVAGNKKDLNALGNNVRGNQGCKDLKKKKKEKKKKKKKKKTILAVD